MKRNQPFWLEVPAVAGVRTAPEPNEIVIVGSGLAGVSSAYWLVKSGVTDITILDYEVNSAASFRNAGHILTGTVESYKALVALHGRQDAQRLWRFSVGLCEEIEKTIFSEGFSCDYKRDGYLVIANSEAENTEILESIKLMNEDGFASDYLTQNECQSLGFRNVHGARFDPACAQAHPVKFRNALLSRCLEAGVKYHSQVKVSDVSEKNSRIVVTSNHGETEFQACILATNAYSSKLSRYFKERRLIEPFKGQILTSRPIKYDFPFKGSHSMDHGYEYMLVIRDEKCVELGPDYHRLLIGGWRNNVPNKEIGSFDLGINKDVSEGLKQFVSEHYDLPASLEYDFEWTGIMGTSKSGLPFIGPTSSPLIFTVSGFTGHGFSWAHGSAKLLAEIVLGGEYDIGIANHFNPAGI